jgi:ATP-binding cassette subfamily B multidrug efflux pump
VDPETEHLLREGLNRLIENRTSLVIAHRLSTIQNASKIVVMHKGRVREIGSHQQLLQKRGIYYKLYQLQYKDQELAVSGAEPGRRRNGLLGATEIASTSVRLRHGASPW